MTNRFRIFWTTTIRVFIPARAASFDSEPGLVSALRMNGTLDPDRALVSPPHICDLEIGPGPLPVIDIVEHILGDTPLNPTKI